MSARWPLQKAKNEFSRVVDRALSEGPQTVTRHGKPVVVVIIAGSAVLVEGWHDRVGAVLQTFYSGMEGGTALARLLFGEVSPSGRLPFTVARNAEDYPAFDRDAPDPPQPLPGERPGHQRELRRRR